MADPGFLVVGGSRAVGGAPTSDVGAFQQKHAKMKELDPVEGEGGGAGGAPTGSANG